MQACARLRRWLCRAAAPARMSAEAGYRELWIRVERNGVDLDHESRPWSGGSTTGLSGTGEQANADERAI
jgi:hypothetical protein